MFYIWFNDGYIVCIEFVCTRRSESNIYAKHGLCIEDIESTKLNFKSNLNEKWQEKYKHGIEQELTRDFKFSRRLSLELESLSYEPCRPEVLLTMNFEKRTPKI